MPENAGLLSARGLPGEIYHKDYEALKEALQWRHAPNATFAPDGHHFLLPAFFHTLAELEKQGAQQMGKHTTRGKTQLIHMR